MIGIVLQLIGLALEIAGVLLMANLYTGIVPLRQLVYLLFSALFRGAEAAGAVEMATLHLEDRLAALQGLAFIGLGFLLQAIGVLLSQLLGGKVT